MRVLNAGDLVLQVRERADLQDTLFVKDEEIQRYLNQAYFGLYNEIAESNEDYFSQTFRFQAIANRLVLPPDFYKLRAIDFYYGSYFYTIKPVSLREREAYQHASAFFRPYALRGWSDLYRYNIEGDVITFYTQEANVGDFIMHYIPEPGRIGIGAKLPRGWENYLILKAAQMCRIKEEASYKEIAMMAEEELNRIRKLCQERDMSLPEKIIDVNTDKLYLSYGDFGSTLPSNLTGIDERTLLPAISRCPYPDFLTENVYKLRKENAYILDSGKRAVLIFNTAEGITGEYGNWIACDVYNDRGFLWFSGAKNTRFATANELKTYLDANRSVTLTIDSKIYTDDVDAFRPSCLFYQNDAEYTLNLDRDSAIPPGTPTTTTKVVPKVSVPSGPTAPTAPTQQPNVYVEYLAPTATKWTAADVTSGALPNAVNSRLETSDFGKGTLAQGATRVSVTTPTWADASPSAAPRDQLVVVDGGARIVGYYLSGFEFNQVASLNYLGTVGGRSYYVSASKLIYRASGQTKVFEVRSG